MEQVAQPKQWQRAPKKQGTRARWVQPHPLHGHLKKIVLVKVPTEGGYFLQKMKLKTAIQKGHYKVNTTDAKTKEAIEKALAPIKQAEATKLQA